MSDAPSRPRRRVRRLDPIWTTAPLSLRSYPGLLAAIAVGALLLALAAAAAPLFLASTTSRLLQAHVADPVVTRWGAGVSYRSGTVPLDRQVPDRAVPLHRRQAQVFADRMREQPLLGPVIRGVLGPEMTLSVAGRPGVRAGRLMGRTDALAHVEVLEGQDGDGVWISDLTARGIAARPGDTVELRIEGGPSVRVEVDGVFRALSSAPDDGYWRAWQREIHPLCEDCPIPPPFVLAEVDQALDLIRAMEGRSIAVGLQAPLASERITLDEGRELEGFAAGFERDISDRRSELHEVFACCGLQYQPYRTRTDFVSNIGRLVDQVERRMVPIEGPVQVLLAAGLVVALAVIGGAGVFAAATRRVEAELLAARGRSATSFGARSAVEAALPAAAGSAAGFGLGVLFTSVLGPGAPVGGAALRSAGATAGLTIPVAAGLVGVASGLSFRRGSADRRPAPGWVARVPWEVLLLIGGVVLLAALRRQGAFVSDPVLEFARPSPLLLVAPVLLLAGAAGAAARGFRLVASRVRDRAEGLGHASYLAVHRLAGARALVVLLVAAAATAFGTFVYGHTVSRSLEATVDAKAGIFVGGDARATVNPDARIPKGVAATKVVRIREVGTLEPGGGRFDLLAVDPSTLASAAYWREGFDDDSLEDLAATVTHRDDGTLRAVLSGPEPVRVRGLVLAQRRLPVEVVDTAAVFPGTSSERPLVVVDEEAFRAAFGPGDPFRLANASTQLWFRGDPRLAREAMAREGIRPFDFLTAAEVRELPSIAAVSATFGVLNILSVAAGVLVLAVLVLYLQARQRAQVVANALTSRMGLGPRGQRRAVLLELGSLVGAAVVAAVVAGLLVALAVVPLLDPLATVQPDPLYVPPVGRFVAGLAVVALACWVGARLASRRADRIALGEVLRVAD